MTTKKNSGLDFKQVRFNIGGWTEQQAAEALGVSLKTYRRYESERNKRRPLAAARLLAILAAGDLGAIHSAWTGWRLIEGKLYSPEYQEFDQTDLCATHYMSQLIDELQRTNGGVLPVPLEQDSPENNIEDDNSNIISGYFPLSINPWFGERSVDEMINLYNSKPQLLTQFLNIKFRVSRRLDDRRAFGPNGSYYTEHWPRGTEAQICALEWSEPGLWYFIIEKLDLSYPWPDDILQNPHIGLKKFFTYTMPLNNEEENYKLIFDECDLDRCKFRDEAEWLTHQLNIKDQIDVDKWPLL